MKHWSDIKERSAGFIRLRFMLYLYRLCGRGIVQIFIYPITFFVVIGSKKVRKYSLDYLTRIHLSKGAKEFRNPDIFSIFKHVFFFSNSLVDKVESWSGNISLSQLNIKTKNAFNSLSKNIELGNGIVLIGSHLGNIELFRALGSIKAKSKSDKPLSINAIVQSNYTSKFSDVLNLIDNKSSTNLISAADIGIQEAIMLNDKIRSGEIIVITGDRTAQKNQNNNLSVNFLGEKASFPLGPFVLANTMRCPAYFVFCLKSLNHKKMHDVYVFEADMKIKSSIKLRKENISKLLHNYVEHLEFLCLKYPYQWFNFFKFWK